MTHESAVSPSWERDPVGGRRHVHQRAIVAAPSTAIRGAQRGSVALCCGCSATEWGRLAGRLVCLPGKPVVDLEQERMVRGVLSAVTADKRRTKACLGALSGLRPAHDSATCGGVERAVPLVLCDCNGGCWSSGRLRRYIGTHHRRHPRRHVFSQIDLANGSADV